MKPLSRGATALEFLIVVALVAFLNGLAAQQYRVQLTRLMAQVSELAGVRNCQLLEDECACVPAGRGGDAPGCRQPGL